MERNPINRESQADAFYPDQTLTKAQSSTAHISGMLQHGARGRSRESPRRPPGPCDPRHVLPAAAGAGPATSPRHRHRAGCSPSPGYRRGRRAAAPPAARSPCCPCRPCAPCSPPPRPRGRRRLLPDAPPPSCARPRPRCRTGRERREGRAGADGNEEEPVGGGGDRDGGGVRPSQPGLGLTRALDPSPRALLSVPRSAIPE